MAMLAMPVSSNATVQRTLLSDCDAVKLQVVPLVHFDQYAGRDYTALSMLA